MVQLEEFEDVLEEQVLVDNHMGNIVPPILRPVGAILHGFLDPQRSSRSHIVIWKEDCQTRQTISNHDIYTRDEKNAYRT